MMNAEDTSLDELITRVLDLDARATPSARWCTSLWWDDAGCVVCTRRTYDPGPDRELVELYRIAAPRLARRVLELENGARKDPR